MKKGLIHSSFLICISICYSCFLSSCGGEEEAQPEVFADIDRQIAGADTQSREEQTRQKLFYNMQDLPSEEFDPRVGRDRELAIIPLEEENGVYFVWVTINGLNLRAVFDTGASDVSLSSTEAMLLYKQGSLTIEDYVGQSNYRIANGDLIPGTVVLLKNVNIGGVELFDVRASIISDPQAPLLLGQSVFKRFRSYSIDNINKEIVLEY
jgi:clan AA aspartic protease (TIGR02281 family)